MQYTYLNLNLTILINFSKIYKTLVDASTRAFNLCTQLHLLIPQEKKKSCVKPWL